MNKVVVVFDGAPESPGEGENNKKSLSHRFTSWIPVDYVVAQLRQDVMGYWQLSGRKYELWDAFDNVLADDTRIDTISTTTFTLRKRKHADGPELDMAPRLEDDHPDDPLWLQERLYDVFLAHALPTWNGKGALSISCYQFKQLIIKALRWRQESRQTNTGSLKIPRDLTMRATLAFKTACANTHTSFGATFDEFLDALVDVAVFLFPKMATNGKEHALERMATAYLIPSQAHFEATTVNEHFSWTDLDIMLAGKKVQAILQRFSQPLAEIATAYSSSNTGPKHQRGLQFPEFAKLIYDIKPSTIPITVHELCYIFIRSCRIELAEKFSPPTPQSTSGLPAISISLGLAAGSGTGKLTSLRPTNSDERGILEVSCVGIARNLAVLALVGVTRLALLKGLSSLEKCGSQTIINRSTTKVHVRKSTMVVTAVKAFWHHISIRLSGRATMIAAAPTRFGSMKKGTTLPLVSISFLQEFQRLHREDGLEDYFNSYTSLIHSKFTNNRTLTDDQHDLIGEQQQVANEKRLDSPEQELSQPEHCDLELEIDWGDKSADEIDSRESSPEHLGSFSPAGFQSRKQEEIEEIGRLINDADEIYGFLAGELQRMATEDRLKDPETVPPMLDIWVAAGQKYAQVLNILDATSFETETERRQQKSEVLVRFGSSLYVLGMQLLKNTTKVFNYEEKFGLTNARAYNGVTAELWDDKVSASFTLDLAMETLSLASGKLGQACQELGWLIRHAREELVAAPSERGLDHSERYYQALLHRANCIALYGDILAHSRPCTADFDLGCTLEDEQDTSMRSQPANECVLFESDVILSKSSRPGQFFREARKLYHFLLVDGVHQSALCRKWIPSLHGYLGATEFKLATQLPRGSLIERRLLDDSVAHFNNCSHSYRALGREDDYALSIQKQNFVSTIRILRHKVFVPETENCDFEERGSETIVPLYRFVLVAAFHDLDPNKTGILMKEQLNKLNNLCGREDLSDSVMTWLVQNFDSQENQGLTERGFLSYFRWLAEADPFSFCDVLDAISAKYMESQIPIADSIVPSTTKTKQGRSLRSILFSQRRPTAHSNAAAKPSSSGIANCVVVLTGKLRSGDFGATSAPSDVELEPAIVDSLPADADIPEELSKFCFPDEIFMSSECLPPRTFDIVLTGITGARFYGSCLHFYEEKDPFELLGMISGAQKEGKTASLPSWISLKDIQQRNTKWRCFVPKCICILASTPHFNTLRESLALIYRLSISTPPFPIEAYVFRLLEEVPLPKSPSTVTVLPLIDRVCVLTGIPPASPTFFPSEIDFTLVFQCLCLENVLRVYSFLLTEKKVVLTSENCSILAPVAETFRSLLYPFECQVVYIPVLPLGLVDFVTAPVPFFMGIRYDQQVDQLITEGVIVVNLDRDEVLIPQTEHIPNLPEVKARKLLQSLKKTCQWAISQRTREMFGRFQPGSLSEVSSFTHLSSVSDDALNAALRAHDEQQERWGEILSLFTSFTMRLLKDFRKFCQRVPNHDGNLSTSFDKRGFLAMNPSQREFCTHLVQTQLFQRFIDQYETISDSVLQLTSSESEQSWRTVRSKNMMARKGDGGDETPKNQPAKSRVIVSPPPLTRFVTSSPVTIPTHRRRPSGRANTAEILAPFNCQTFDDLKNWVSSSGNATQETNRMRSFPKRPSVSATATIEIDSTKADLVHVDREISTRVCGASALR